MNGKELLPCEYDKITAMEEIEKKDMLASDKDFNGKLFSEAVLFE